MQSLTLPASINQLTVLNEFLASNLPAQYSHIAGKIELAIEELLVNICDYAYAEKRGEVKISCRVVNFDDNLCFCIVVCDYGKAYDPFLEHKEPDLLLSIEERPVGGLGVFLVKQMVSHYCYYYANDANFTELYFFLTESAE